MPPRPGIPETGTTGPKNRGLVFPEGDIADPNAQRGYRRGWHRRCWTLFRVQRGRLLTSSRQRVRRIRGEKPQVRTRILLPRPGAPARGHYRPKEPRTDVPSRGHCRPTKMSNEATDGLVPSVFAIFRAQLERILALFRQRAKKDPRRDTTGSDSRRAPEAWCFPNGDIADPNSNTAFDPSLEYSTDKVVLFWQAPSYFPPWPPSSFAVDDVPYSCAEQYMMTENTRLFQDHRAVGLIMSSPSPSTRKRIGRGVRNFDSAVGHREKQNAVLSGTYAKFTQNRATKKSPFEL